MKTIYIRKQFTIEAPIDYVFQLICPVMEYKWIPGWKTKLVHCPNGKNEKGVIFKEKMSTPFIMGKAVEKTTWKTLLYDTEYHKAHFRWDNKISTSIFKIEMYSMGLNQTKCFFKLNMSPINSKGEEILDQKCEYKTDFLLTGLGGMLKYFCEHSTMINTKGSDRKADFLNNLSSKEKLVFLHNKLHMKLMYDRDKKRFLSQGTIRKRTLSKS